MRENDNSFGKISGSNASRVQFIFKDLNVRIFILCQIEKALLRGTSGIFDLLEKSALKALLELEDHL